MSQGVEIRSFDYVNHPYGRVRDVLTADAATVFQAATGAAASRARDVASQLHVNLAGIDVATDIAITVTSIDDPAEGAPISPATGLHLEWESAKLPRLFPFMKARMLIYPLTATETQLDFSGTYAPPLGALGKVVNAIGAHRLADVSVHQFVAEVARYLRTTLAKTPPA